MGLLLDLECRRVAQWRQRVRWLLADKSLELPGQALDLLVVLVLAPDQVLDGGEIR